MKNSWFSGLEPDAKEQMRDYFKGSSLLRERLGKILEDKVKNKRKLTSSIEAYESPAWAYTQADTNGYERAIKEVIELISN